MRGATTLAIVLSAASAVPATAAAASRTTYSIVKAGGYERLTFASDPTTCAQYGTCGDSGNVSYTFGGTPRGSFLMTTDSRGRTMGAAAFRSHGKTVAEVTSAATGSCRDTVNHGRERFLLASRSRLGRLLFTFHPRSGGSDYLKTDCLAPSEVALARSRALPQGMFPAKDFRRARTSFGLKGEESFRGRGYQGSVKWSLAYRIARRG